jgi:hypothetical protein
LEDIRLRLIEMGDTAAAEAMLPQMERLKKGVDYHQHVLIAVRARLSRSQPEPALATPISLPWTRPRPAAPISRSYEPRPMVALSDAEEVA